MEPGLGQRADQDFQQLGVGFHGRNLKAGAGLVEAS
jgi:hypothetical protein